MRTLIAVALVAFAASSRADEPKKFESKDGKFAAQFPGEVKTYTQKTGGGDLNITAVEKGKSGFLVMYTDLPGETLKGRTETKILEDGENGLAKNFQAKVTKSEESTFKSNGKEYTARRIVAEKGDLYIRLTLVLAGNRLYQVLVVGPKHATTGQDADDFVKSFEITN
jgi:hypothetical protein